MWRRIAPVVFVFSVALNISFLVVWGVQTLQGQTGVVGEFGEGESGEACYGGHRVRPPVEMSLEQRERIKPLLEEIGRERSSLCRRMDRARQELIDALASTEPDSGLIERRQAEILGAQRQMQDLTVRQLLKEKEVLTPQQQQALFAYFRDCCRCSYSEVTGTGRGGSCGGR